MQETTTPKEAKVFQLCKELDEMKTRKKDNAKAYNNEIRRIQDEIKELLDTEDQPEAD